MAVQTRPLTEAELRDYMTRRIRKGTPANIEKAVQWAVQFLQTSH